MNFTTIIDTQDDQFALWIGHDPRNGEYVADLFAKVEGGIKNLVHRYQERPSEKQLQSDVLKYGKLSPRPYQPGQACDGSITTSALALFLDYCQSADLDPSELYRQAYPDESHDLPDWKETRRFAEWQGVAYPPKWTKKAYALLRESLTAINYHSLRSTLTYPNHLTKGHRNTLCASLAT